MFTMRTTLVQELSALERGLTTGFDAAAHTICHLDEAILAPRPDAVDTLAQAGERLRALSRDSDLQLVTLLARHAPVACDLRLVLAMIQIAQHGGLIANQLTLISEQLSQIDAGVTDRCRTGEAVASMSRVAGEQLGRATRALAERDGACVHRLETDDDVLDQLNKQVCRSSLELDATPEQRELAFRHILIARSLERIGDNAVRIAAQTAGLVQADIHHLTQAAPADSITSSAA